MTAAQLITLFRAAALDTVAPYLWSDNELLAYTSDAQEMFCRQTAGIRDALSGYTVIKLQPGKQFAAISDRVLRIREARLASSYETLTVLNTADLPQSSTRPRSGAPRTMTIGVQDGYVMFDTVPDTADKINMIIERLPSELSCQNDELEILPMHHQSLLHWITHRAYQKQDAETFDQQRSATARALFMDACSKARSDQERLIHNNKTVAYGGL